MWLFTRYGFFSIAASQDEPDSVMIRARDRQHLEALEKRFPSIADAAILDWPDRDYRWRIVILRHVWSGLLYSLAQEQDWSNFKQEAEDYQTEYRAFRFTGAQLYLDALHRIWRIMHDLQQARSAR